jgi:hypothetical protein
VAWVTIRVEAVEAESPVAGVIVTALALVMGMGLLRAALGISMALAVVLGLGGVEVTRVGGLGNDNKSTLA